jgi:hypothetical protein
MSWPDRDDVKAVQERINGERRFDRRYDIALDLRWKLVRRKKVLDTGIGRTVDLSSGGVRFDAGRMLPLGLGVELAIAWPALLHNVSPMQLVISGRIVRSTSSHTAIQLIQHEFRTAGAPGGNRPSPGGQRGDTVILTGGPGLGKFETLQ